MTTETPNNDNLIDHDSNSETDNPAAQKKTAKKRATRKRTPKAAAKKTASKKAASKKTTKKKAAKKSTRKKAASKPAPADDADAEADTGSDDDQGRSPAMREDRADALDDQENQDSDDDTRGNDGDESGSDDEPSARSSSSSSSSRSRSSKRTSKKAPRKPSAQSSSRSSTRSSSSSRSKSSPQPTNSEMVINYVPGEECRVAMVEDGKLEELAVEPTDRVSRVGNIYVGRVANIEASIQAVFVDFGTEENGFLHISDLHPQYFAKGDEKTERVGKKTPRRSRPPVQDCLKRGQEIIVQVLKEGVGTKGPTLTSYLSIPGRFLVMMPGMDKVGVSRKEEDDDKRKAAKQILSQLELPEGFGFILRTAGFDRNKAELKRDLAYLARLWKDMEARRRGGKKPRLLYTESDLLVRSIRDLLTSEVSRVVIDSEPALKRVARFIKIAAPRSGAKLSHYNGTKPIFHAFGIESQINEIHAREVMLPSGGRLVIDQTEALVAIDVNSGKSRGARDAETNAFQTNMEAVDAICRQLRLRDLGGLVVNDMIDMRYQSHRKEVESRFTERLKRDRAKTSTAPISPFGLLEMTRQRMRGSLESQHFADCPMCHGRGLVKRPDSVASTALRDLATLLDHEKVFRAELVVNPRVASALLSTRRSSLTRIELVSGKTLDVRVSESLPIDRVSFYAYDQSGSDIAIEQLKPAKRAEPSVVEWNDGSSADGSWAMDPLDEVDETTVQKLAEEIARKADQAEHAQLPVEGELDDEDERNEKSDGSDHAKKKRRRRRGGRGRSGKEHGDQHHESERSDPKAGPDADPNNPRRDRSDDDDSSDADDSSAPARSHHDESAEDADHPRKKRRRRRRGGRGRSGSDSDSGTGRESGRHSDPGSDDDHDPRDADDSSEESGSGPSADSDRAQRPARDADTRTDRADDQSEPRPRRRPRRRPARGSKPESGDSQRDDQRDDREDNHASSSAQTPPGDAPGKRDSGRVTEPKPKSRGRSGSDRDRGSAPKESAPAADADAPKPRKGLYSKTRRVLSASELAKLGLE